MKTYAFIVLGSLLVSAELCAASKMPPLSKNRQIVSAVRKLRTLDEHDIAFHLAFKHLPSLPAKEQNEVKLVLGQLSLHDTEHGMKYNSTWARHWFNEVATSGDATPEMRAEAKLRLHRLDITDPVPGKKRVILPLVHPHAKHKTTMKLITTLPAKEIAPAKEKAEQGSLCAACGLLCKNNTGLASHKRHRHQ